MKKENLIIIPPASFLPSNQLFKPLFPMLGFIFPESTILRGIVEPSLMLRLWLGSSWGVEVSLELSLGKPCG